MTRHSSNEPAHQGAGGALRQRLHAAALDAGFDVFGVCRAERLDPERDRYLRWIAEGHQGEMRWIDPEWVERATDPGAFLKSARSVICVALSYAGPPAGPTPPGCGRLARYAGGRDYHEAIGDRLKLLGSAVASVGGGWRPFVDTAPTMDKALAVRAGLGWQGRSTNVLSEQLGSFIFLGGIATDLDLPADTPARDGCGSCRACVAACPTGALRGDYTIDARLCISYLTIEHRGSIPRHLRPLIGDWVFGCDLCQDVCPPAMRLQDREFPEMKEARIAFVRQILGDKQSSGLSHR